MQQQKIQVALSGGVDSAVVAALLKEWGYDVTGVYMKNWANNNGISDSCPWEEDVAEVEKVANHLGIPWKVYNFEKEYKERILDYFFAEYKAGRTPNPDILCNNLIKFDLFASRAFAEGATHIATGHYARRQSSENFPWERQGELALYTALDGAKDQTYFLQRLSTAQLSQALFPLGNLYKSEVRALATHFNLPNATRKDSQGICFIGDVDVRDFIREHLQTNPGDIIDIDQEKVIGKHQGLWFYTIGQRQGIGIASPNEPYFVVGKNAAKNQLEVAKGHEHPRLLKNEIRVNSINVIGQEMPVEAEILVSLRYRERPQKACIVREGNEAVLTALEQRPFWAPAAGQSVLMYQENVKNWYSEKRGGKFNVKQELMRYFTGRETIRRNRVLGGAFVS